MKKVELHDGRCLEFPPETADSIIDETVRRELGVPEPPDFEKLNVEIASEGVRVLKQIQAPLVNFAKEVGQIAPALEMMASKNHNEELSAKLDYLIETNKTLSEHTRELSIAVSEGVKAIIQAYNTPKVLHRSPDNKTATLQIAKTGDGNA